MQQLIYFFRKFKYFLFFLLLEFIALFLIINNHSFHRSKFVSSTRDITGFFYEKNSNLTNYLNLKEENNYLVQENLNLKNQINKLKSFLDTVQLKTHIDSTIYYQKYQYLTGNITKNEFHKPFNYLLIDKGEKDSVFKEMAVINDKGIIGITDQTSNRYARVRSILNKNSRINARFKKNFYFGTLIWNGIDYRKVQLVDIPRQANVNVGDTIITGGKSTIFPEGILIGKVVKINLESTSTNNLEIELFNDMSNIKNIYIVNNFDKKEIRNLEINKDE